MFKNIKYQIDKIHVSSITSERIELESMLRCLNDRLDPTDSHKKIGGLRTIFRGVDQTMFDFLMQVLANFFINFSLKISFS